MNSAITLVVRVNRRSEMSYYLFLPLAPCPLEKVQRGRACFFPEACGRDFLSSASREDMGSVSGDTGAKGIGASCRMPRDERWACNRGESRRGSAQRVLFFHVQQRNVLNYLLACWFSLLCFPLDPRFFHVEYSQMRHSSPCPFSFSLNCCFPSSII